MDERLRILEMVREGKVSPEEATRLLDALETERPRGVERGRLLRVQVRRAAGDNVNVAVPLALADVVLRFLPKGLRVTANGEEIDITRLVGDLRDSGARGKIVDVTEADGGHVEISVE
jgi:hypothetical protein